MTGPCRCRGNCGSAVSAGEWLKSGRQRMLGWDNPVTPFPSWVRQDSLVLTTLRFLGLHLGAEMSWVSV